MDVIKRAELLELIQEYGQEQCKLGLSIGQDKAIERDKVEEIYKKISDLIEVELGGSMRYEK